MAMAIESDDYYFLKPVAVPFKWEIRPGVPKVQFSQKSESEPEAEEPKPKLKPRPSCYNHHLSRLSPPELTPPPSGSFLRPLESRAGSFRSAPRTRSERWRFDRTALSRPETMSPGCFPAAGSLKRNESKRMGLKVRSVAEPHYSKDLETLARWSASGRRSLSPFGDSPSSSSSCSSHWSNSNQSSPLALAQPVSDAEWAAFGLF